MAGGAAKAHLCSGIRRYMQLLSWRRPRYRRATRFPSMIIRDKWKPNERQHQRQRNVEQRMRWKNISRYTITASLSSYFQVYTWSCWVTFSCSAIACTSNTLFFHIFFFYLPISRHSYCLSFAQRMAIASTKKSRSHSHSKNWGRTRQ